MKKDKVFYIDNLRVVLTGLVILHHSFITYGAPGGWYYSEKTTQIGALVPMTLFVAVNQSFFMGFFFFLSALFTESSYAKKGRRLFIADRLKRLGLPLIFYSLVISPVLAFLAYKYGYGNEVSVSQFLRGYHEWINFGVLWFVAALLIFNVLYVLFRPQPKPVDAVLKSPPSAKAILLFAFSLGAISYLVRFLFPVGWVLHPLGFQPAHFSQYIALFIMGIIAARERWLDQPNSLRPGNFIALVAVLVLVVFPGLYVIKVVTNCSLEAFSGGGTYQSALSAVWEQLTGISIIVILLIWGKRCWNEQSGLMKQLSRAAYCVYIIHPLILVPLSLSVKGLDWNPVHKLLLVAPVAVILSFLAGVLLVRIPVINRVV